MSKKEEEEYIPITPPVVGHHNNYLDERTASIRTKVIPWEGYERAALITSNELTQIRIYEKNPAQALNEAGDRYVMLFITLLQKLVRTDTIQNILVIIDGILQEREDHSKIFYRLAEEKGDPAFPYATFVKLLKKDDEYIQLKAAIIITQLLIRANPAPSYDPNELFGWLVTQTYSANQNVSDIAIQLLQSTLSIPSYRVLFYDTRNGVSSLLDILKKGSPTAQMQYQVIYCFWQMSFVPEISADIQQMHNIIPVFVDIAKSAIKEKVVRAVVSTFLNMLTKAPAENMMPMLGNKLLNLCETLIGRKWSDTDISDDLEFMRDELGKNVQDLSTFDEYVAEVRSGQLDWSPPHLSEQFWKNNASRFNDQDNELLKMLSRLITTSSNPIVLAVAAHDIGQYIKYGVNSKRRVQEVGAKTQVMELMGHEHPDVRYQALLAVQKYMTHAWEY